MWFDVENVRNIPVCGLQSMDLTRWLLYIWLFHFIKLLESTKWCDALDAFEIDAHLLRYIPCSLVITSWLCISLKFYVYAESIHVWNTILIGAGVSRYSRSISYLSFIVILQLTRISHWTDASTYVSAK